LTEIPRRAVLRGTALSAMAMAASAPAANSPADAARPLLEGGKLAAALVTVADRTALTQLRPVTPGQISFLAEEGRQGFFQCVTGSKVSNDQLQGLQIPSSTAGLFHVRIWDNVEGRPEWFGARVNDGNADCADAIEACYALCPITQLSQADYYIRRTMHFSRNARVFRGVGNWGRGAGLGTRIILHRSAPAIHTADIMVVGSRDRPLIDSESYPTDNHFSNFTLLRDGACMPHMSADPALYPSGLRASFLFHCTFRQITSLESSIGFHIGGTVYTTFDDCYVIRAQPGTSSASDFNIGYLLNGLVSFGYSGGNASLYVRRCSVADSHPRHVSPVGLLARGAFVDTFIDDFESARIATGMAFAVQGQKGTGQSIDAHIRNPVLDGCSRMGIDLDLGDTATASIDIIDPYIAADSVRGGDYGISIHGGAGLVTVTGGQIHSDFRGGSLHFSQTFGASVKGTKVHQASRPVVIDDAGSLFLEPQISNVDKTSPNFAITAVKLSRSIVRPMVTGWNKAAFKGGVSLDATSHHNEIDGSAINPDWFSAANPGFKVHYKGGDARSGASGAAFAAAGNRLVGVTD